MLACVCVAILVYQGRLARATPGGTRDPGAPRTGGALVIISLLLWVGIIFAGRWIAYASGK
jgi:hypothetical protein